MADPRDEKAQRESKAILDRIEVESMMRGDSMTDRLVRHFTVGEANAEDKADLWGKRVGRVLAAAFLVMRAVMLIRLLMG